MDTWSLDTEMNAFVVIPMGYYGIFSTVIVDTLSTEFTRKFMFYASTEDTFKWERKSPKHKIKNGLR